MNFVREYEDPRMEEVIVLSTVQLGTFVINGQMLLTLCFGAAG